MKRPNQIRTKSSKNYNFYELHRKSSSGGGLCIGVHKDIKSVWINQGDDEVECLIVEVWLNDFPVRIMTAYGPQLGDLNEKKSKFWQFIEKEADLANKIGAGFILQMDGNCHLGKDIIKNDVNEKNANGKLFTEFLDRMPNLCLANALEICDGTITRTRKTVNGTEQAALDVFMVCDKLLPYFRSVKKLGRVTESDHNQVEIELNMDYSKVKTERVEMFDLKNKKAQQSFKTLTTNTDEFTNCFIGQLPLEAQAKKWRKVLTKYLHKSFKRIRIRNKPRIKKT